VATSGMKGVRMATISWEGTDWAIT
jgi:hypothetical protein